MDRNLFIASNSFLQSRLLAQAIEQCLDRQCRHVKASDIEKHMPDDVKPNDLLLYDMANQDLNSSLYSGNPIAKLMQKGVMVALINVNESEDAEETAIDRGFKGAFLSNDSVDHISKGIQSILHGELWFSRKALSNYVVRTACLTKCATSRAHVKLTQREVQILSIIAAGGTNSDIAKKLNISMNTVKCHVYNIFSKIHADNRTKAALWAANNIHAFSNHGA